MGSNVIGSYGFRADGEEEPSPESPEYLSQVGTLEVSFEDDDKTYRYFGFSRAQLRELMVGISPAAYLNMLVREGMSYRLMPKAPVVVETSPMRGEARQATGGSKGRSALEEIFGAGFVDKHVHRIERDPNEVAPWVKSKESEEDCGAAAGGDAFENSGGISGAVGSNDAGGSR